MAAWYFTIIKAILSVENSVKPLGGRGSARTPLGSSQRSPDLLAGGEGVAAPPKEPTPLSGFGPSVLLPMTNPGRTPELGMKISGTGQRAASLPGRIVCGAP